MTKSTLLNHIDTHLKADATSECPHPLCNVPLKHASDFRAHFQDSHSIEEPRSNCVNRKRKREDEEEIPDTKEVGLKRENTEEMPDTDEDSLKVKIC